jgi:hypothetical protein
VRGSWEADGMHNDIDPENEFAPAERSARETFLATLLLSVFGVGVVTFLFLMCGVSLLWAFIELAGLCVLGLVHYLIWGRALYRKTAGEREEEELRVKAELDGWPLPEPRQPRHL